MLPIFYTFRRCPFCMRAHMALLYSDIAVELREVELRRLPEALLQVSPKATVPVLVWGVGKVIDESWDIVLWALAQHDPFAWLGAGGRYRKDAEVLVKQNDGPFKMALDRYKYADRYPEFPRQYYRREGELFLQLLEQRLQKTRYLMSNDITVADIAVLPFVRQFAMVDKTWFDQLPYVNLQSWLAKLLVNALFSAVMVKRSVWVAC